MTIHPGRILALRRLEWDEERCEVVYIVQRADPDSGEAFMTVKVTWDREKVPGCGSPLLYRRVKTHLFR